LHASPLDPAGPPNNMELLRHALGSTPVFTDAYEKADSGHKERSCQSVRSSVPSSSAEGWSRRASPGHLRPGGRELGIRDTLLTGWKREAQSPGAIAFRGTGTPRDEELARLKRELARVKKVRDSLREAATFFAKGSS